MIRKQASTDLEIFSGQRGDRGWQGQAMASEPLKPKNAGMTDIYAVENDMFSAHNLASLHRRERR
jgi:hypothetical protein